MPSSSGGWPHQLLLAAGRALHSDERLWEIVRQLETLGIRLSNPHSYILEDKGARVRRPTCNSPSSTKPIRMACSTRER